MHFLAAQYDTVKKLFVTDVPIVPHQRELSSSWIEQRDEDEDDFTSLLHHHRVSMNASKEPDITTSEVMHSLTVWPLFLQSRGRCWGNDLYDIRFPQKQNEL